MPGKKFYDFIHNIDIDAILIACEKPFNNKIGNIKIIDFIQRTSSNKTTKRGMHSIKPFSTEETLSI